MVTSVTGGYSAVEDERFGEAPVLRVRDLTVVLSGAGDSIRPVNNVSLEVHAGESIGVVGESGSGKTVLCKTIMGLLGSSGTTVTGEVMFGERNLLKLDEEALRGVRGSAIGMIFQDPMSALNPVVRIGRQISEVLCAHKGMTRRQAKETSIGILKSVGISEAERRMRQYPHELSGGMRQRVVIAMAIACKPAVLLADEPTTALDVTVQAQILDLIRSIQERNRTALVLVTHDLSIVAGRTDVVAVMYAGRVVEIAPTVALFSNMKMPYTQALFQAAPRLDMKQGSRLVTIPGVPADLRVATTGCAFAARCSRAQDRCRSETPPLESIDDPKHKVACWYPLEHRVGL